MKAAFHPLAGAVALIVGAVTLQADDTTQPAVAIHANVEIVDDMRSTMSSGGCRLNAVLFGDDLDDVLCVLGTRITKAEDDIGRSLVPIDQPTSRVPVMSPFRMGPLHTPLRTVFNLRNPSRRATSIKVLDATVRLFRPTEANGGLVIISSPTLHPGASLKNDALAKSHIELVYVRTDEGPAFPLLGSSAATTPDEQKRLDAVAAEVAARRIAREQMAAAASGMSATVASAESASATIPPSSAHLETTEPTAGSPHPVRRTTYRSIFRVLDPDRRLLGLEWRDANDDRVHGFGGWGTEENRTVTTTERPTEDWTLVVFVGTDDAIASQPIHLENIALP